jgi:hypothetical protein
MTPTKILHIVLKREWSTNEAEKEKKREKKDFFYYKFEEMLFLLTR